MSYHLRVTITRSDAPALIEKFLDAFLPALYVFAYEEKDANHHIHAHLEYNENKGVPAKQTISDFFKKNNLQGKYYHKSVKKDDNSNLLYVTKDLNILRHNVAELAMDEILNKTKAINKDKKLHARHKLLERVKASQQLYLDELAQLGVTDENEFTLLTVPPPPFAKLADSAVFIMNIYVDEYDKEPPLAHMRGYVLYIATKLITMWEGRKCFIPLELGHYWENKI